jgi:hypothetical protein
MNKPNDNIQLEFAAPQGTYSAAFDKNTKVEDVIQQVRTALSLPADAAFELWFGKTRLEPEARPLVSFHLPNPAKVTLLATGSGV